MSGELSVGGIDTLRRQGQMLSNYSIDWNKNVEDVYRILNEVKQIWHGDFSKKYVDAVESIQQDLVDFANVLNGIAVKIKNIAAMFDATEQYGDVNEAKLEVAGEFDLTEVIQTASSSEVTFNSEIIRTKATEMLDASKAINSIIDDVDSNKTEIAANYRSDGAAEIIDKITKMKEAAPNYVKAIEECATTLGDVVAPQYEKIENYAGSTTE